LEAAILMDKLVTPIQVEIPLKNANIPKKIWNVLHLDPP
jgi:hypothetical protein